jgi:hypothetical protein
MTGLLDSAQIKDLAREESVRGVLVRMALAQAEQSDSQERVLLEKALLLLLARFEEGGGNTP